MIKIAVQINRKSVINVRWDQNKDFQMRNLCPKRMCFDMNVFEDWRGGRCSLKNGNREMFGLNVTLHCLERKRFRT